MRKYLDLHLEQRNASNNTNMYRNIHTRDRKLISNAIMHMTSNACVVSARYMRACVPACV